MKNTPLNFFINCSNFNYRGAWPPPPLYPSFRRGLCPLHQGFSTTGPRTGAGPWLNQYLAAQELISYFCFYLLSKSGTIIKEDSLLYLQLVGVENIKYKCKIQEIINCERSLLITRAFPRLMVRRPYPLPPLGTFTVDPGWSVAKL